MKLQKESHRALLRHLVAVALVVVAAAMRIWPLQALGARLAYLTFYPAVTISSIYGGASAGLLTAFLSALVVIFWHPAGQHFIRDSADWLGMAVFLTNGVLVSLLSEAMHRARTRAEKAKRRAEAAERELEVANKLLEAQNEELHRQTGLLQSVLDNMKDGVIVADKQERFQVFNPAAEAILTTGSTDAPSSQWPQHYGVFLPDTTTPFPAEQLPLVRAIRGESSHDVEMFMRSSKAPNGAWLSVSGSPMRDTEGRLAGGIAVLRDITEMRRTREELACRVEELNALNQELEAFTYSVSHDLRAPLRHIDGFSKILLEEAGPKLDGETQHYLARIREGSQHMGRLVDDLLNLARVGRRELNLQLTGLNSVVEKAVGELKPEIQDRKIEFRIGRLPFVECDPALMQQVFMNLLSNAVKYTRPREQAVIEVDQSAVNGEPAIYVRDNGVGFSMKYAGKLFGVFQRLHRQEDFEGTGVGLATVQRIVRKHGGRVWAQAELDKGATFYFTLEVSEQRASAATLAAAERG